MRTLGVVGLCVLMVGCGQVRSWMGQSEVTPVLVSVDDSGEGSDISKTVFRSVPAESVEPLEILSLPFEKRPVHQQPTTFVDSTGEQEARVLPVVRFPYNSWRLTPMAKANLRDAGSWLRGFMPGSVAVLGHADARGSQAYNQVLGLRRAYAVLTYLRRLGVNGDDLRGITFGELHPVCVDVTEGCYSKNRRAVVVVEQRDGPEVLSGLQAFPPMDMDEDIAQGRQ